MTARSVPQVGVRYALDAQLGAGGVAVVHRAMDRRTGQWIAIKQLRLQDDDDRREMLQALFAREYHTLARLRHRRIVQVYDYGVGEDGPYYTMELLDGADLSAAAPLAYRSACRYLRDVASSLSLVHAHRLVHRDVSPRNIRVTGDGQAKLIDFGALTAFGVHHEVIGTPPCTAPEVLRRGFLDQRTDLYALGAVAYFLLTRRHAYPARTHRDLMAAWKALPPPPSAFDDAIPASLDALVLSLLRTDPEARPPNTAVVIEQLTSIADLEPDEDAEAGASYLQSGPMVGRDHQLRWIRECLKEGAAGRGTAVIAEGPEGIGRTRMLQEVCLEGQLHGMTLVTADAQQDPSALGAAKALVLSLWQACPEATARAGARHAGILGHILPGLARELGRATPDALPFDPSERRARLQMALHDLCLAAVGERPLMIAVDDIHLVDEDSAALLAALALAARNHPLVLMLTQRTGAEVAAPTALRVLRRHSQRLRLRPLDETACHELVRSMFCSAENSGRLAHLLYERSTGNPQRCMDLAKLLVKRGLACYMGGTWVLPQDVPPDELPAAPDQLAAIRLDDLSDCARSFAQALSVCDRAVDLPQALAVAEDNGLSAEQAHAALDELLREQILRLDLLRYDFAQPSLRAAALRGMDPELRRRQHTRAAEMLFTGTEGGAMLVEAGWQWLLAGEETRGADLLASSVSALLRNGLDEPESYERVVEALIAALAVYDKQGREDHEVAPLLFALMSLGFLVDWRIAATYGERAIAVGLELTGLGRAARLERWVGARPAVALALLGASAGFAARRLRGQRYGMITAIREFCAIVPPTIAAWTLRYDGDGAWRLVEQLAPLRLLGPKQVTTLMHDYGVMQVMMIQGRDREVRTLARSLIERFDDPRVKRIIGDLHWRMLMGGVLFARGILATFEYERGELEIIEELERLDVRLWAMGADQLRLLHHAHRGESDQVEYYLERIELFSIQGGTTWQAELYWPFLLLPCYVEASDVVGARRCVAQLDRRARESASMSYVADVGRAALLTLQGKPSAAIELFERHQAVLGPDVRVAWPVTRLWYAQALMGTGQVVRAREVLNESLAALGDAERRLLRHEILTRRLLAMTLAQEGRGDAAAELLDGLLAAHGGADQPLVVGLLHKARAEVAALMEDGAAFEHHVQAMGTHFWSTRNPALVAQWQRLGASVATFRSPRAMDADDEEDVTATLGTEVTVCSGEGRRDTQDGALQKLLRAARCHPGHLYAFKERRLQWIASTCHTRLDSGVEDEVFRRARWAFLGLRRGVDGDSEPENVSVIHRAARRLHDIADGGPHAQPARQPEAAEVSEVTTSLWIDVEGTGTEQAPLHMALLTRQQGGASSLFGLIVVEASGGTPPPLSRATVDALAASMHPTR